MNYRKTKLFFLAVMFFGIFGLAESSSAACTGVSPTWTSTPDYDSVSSCVSQATAEDTVIVTTGNTTWLSTLEIRKGINLIGTGNPTITINAANGILYTPTAATAAFNYPLRISGFTFVIGSKRAIGMCGYYSYGIGCLRSDYMGASTPQTKIRIDHNTFSGTTGAGAGIEISGRFWGVIDNNIFSYIKLPNRHWGGDGASGKNNWLDLGAYTYGSQDTMWYEDNTYIASGNYMISDCDTGGRYSYRYNTITQEGDLQPAFDYHEGGLQGNNHWGCFGGEIYGNTITTNGYNSYILRQRGGHVLAFLNDVGMTTGVEIGVYNDSCPPDDHYDEQLIQDSYFWGNKYGLAGSIVDASITGDACGTQTGHSLTPLAEGKNFWDDTTNNGVRCDALDSMPTTCAIGQGYWATNQSCSDLTGMVGANPATPISGTLYKCTAPNTWTAYYTPYAYPHPLRAYFDSLNIDTIPPSSPTGLMVQ